MHEPIPGPSALNVLAHEIVAANIDEWGWGPLSHAEGLAEHILAVRAVEAGLAHAEAAPEIGLIEAARDLLELYRADQRTVGYRKDRWDCLAAILEAAPSPTAPRELPQGMEVDRPPHWLEPYRTMDAGGSPESAGQVGHQWLYEIARAEHELNPAALSLDNPRLGPDGTAQVLYRGTKLLAAALIFRDPMNFAVLLRYRANTQETER